jgi:hypothetical protein
MAKPEQMGSDKRPSENPATLFQTRRLPSDNISVHPNYIFRSAEFWLTWSITFETRIVYAHMNKHTLLGTLNRNLERNTLFV